MRILTAIVVGLGILIVAAGGLLAYGIFAKTRTAGPTAAAKIGPFGSLGLGLPEKCAIKSVVPSDHNLIIHVQGVDLPHTPSACDRIIVVDLATGRVLGDIAARVPRP